MSRSRRKVPIFGITTAESEAIGKRLWHKRARAIQRGRLANSDDPFPVVSNEAGNVWSLEKDGKRYWAAAQPEHMRK